MTGRRRSYAWQDPGPAYEQLGRHSGLDYLKLQLAGEIEPSPICAAMRLRLSEVAQGRVAFEGEPGEDHYNAVGGVQAGWTAALMDAAVGSAVF